MNIFVSGSLAYDVIMNFPDRFTSHILPDKLHALSVSFTVDRLHKNFGGTAGNIAYTLAVLGAHPLVHSPLGNDGNEYRAHLKKYGVNDTYIGTEDVPTAAAHIITDQDNNQITAFYPGALMHVGAYSLNAVKEKLALAIIAPSTPSAMLQHAHEAHVRGVPYVFDPGQQITQLSGEEIKKILEHAAFVVANDYEWSVIQKKIGMSEEEIRALPELTAAVVTLGANGSRVLPRGEDEMLIAAGKTEAFVDPTGAGDAYRAGFFASLLKGASLSECAQAGSIAALFAVEYHGTQNPQLSLETFRARFRETYGGEPSL